MQDLEFFYRIYLLLLNIFSNYFLFLQKLPRDPSTGFQGGGDGQQMSNQSAAPQTMMATAQVPASSSTSTASSIGGPMVSLRSNLSDHTNRPLTALFAMCSHRDRQNLYLTELC